MTDAFVIIPAGDTEGGTGHEAYRWEPGFSVREWRYVWHRGRYWLNPLPMFGLRASWLK